MIKFIKIKKQLSKITFTHFLLVVIALIIFFGFYYSSSEFRNKVFLLKNFIQHFGYSVKYEEVGTTFYNCEYGSIDQSEYNEKVSYLNNEINKQETLIKQKQGLTSMLSVLQKYNDQKDELAKLNDNLKIKVQTSYGIMLETKSRFDIPFSKNYFYLNEGYQQKEISNNCECMNGLNKENICKWISYSEPKKLKYSVLGGKNIYTEVK